MMGRRDLENAKPILLDCDGVVAGFNELVTKLATERGFPVTVEECKGDCRQNKWWEDAGLEVDWLQPGFCESIPVLPGSQEFVENLRKLDVRVCFLTSPPKDNPTWPHERRIWLEKNFGAKRTDVMFAVDKRYVNGLTFLDDHVRNILDWQDYQQRAAILVERPWNEDILKDCVDHGYKALSIPTLSHQKRRQTIRRTNNWNHILEYVSMLLKLEDK